MIFDWPLLNPIPKAKANKARVSIQFQSQADFLHLPQPLQLEGELTQGGKVCRIILFTPNPKDLSVFLKEKGGIPLSATISIPDNSAAGAEEIEPASGKD